MTSLNIDGGVEDRDTPVETSRKDGEGELKGEEFDIMSLPAPLKNPDDFPDDIIDPAVSDGLHEERVDGQAFDSSVDVDSLPPWDVVFLPGEEPRLVVRAALITDEGNDDEVSLVESSVPLTEDDVDRFLKLALKVEKYHSVKSKLGRRIVAWAMRRKFFAGVTAFILLFLTVMTIINIFR